MGLDSKGQPPKNGIEDAYDTQGNAKHYDDERLNTIVKMEAIWGTQAIVLHCEITAFKYRERAGKKKGQSLEQEILKANWYENAAKFFFEKSKGPDAVFGIDRTDYAPLKKHGLPWEK